MKTVINIKADKRIKEDAQELANELGIPLGTIINAYLRQLIRTREVYFSHIPKMTPELELIVGKSLQDLKNKKNIAGPFNSAKEMDEYLDSV